MTLSKSDLSQFYGTTAYHPWSILFRNMFLTDGAKHVAEEGNAYWLMDAIASHQPDCLKHQMLREIQFWKLERKGNGAVLTCKKDSGHKPTVRQEIEFTDFPLDEIALYVAPIDDRRYVIMLPTEN
ncbi:MAG: hypothetical protein DWQ19_08715 [Crenarchaeota archaeon]|nr:MAG: hypothetical protein DWQ19_08715 [Thermoproteota archaeon]